MIRRATMLLLLMCGATPSLRGQYLAARKDDGTVHAAHPMTWRRSAPHYGKWLTAAGSLGLTVLGAEQHRYSRRDWNSLLEICRSAADACTIGSDGRYLRNDAEQLYQRSRAYDRRANRWLLGAQASLLVTTALFIIDLHPGEGPDNIPFPGGGDLTVTPLPDGAAVGMRLHF